MFIVPWLSADHKASDDIYYKFSDTDVICKIRILCYSLYEYKVKYCMYNFSKHVRIGKD